MCRGVREQGRAPDVADCIWISKIDELGREPAYVDGGVDDAHRRFGSGTKRVLDGGAAGRLISVVRFRQLERGGYRVERCNVVVDRAQHRFHQFACLDADGARTLRDFLIFGRARGERRHHANEAGSEGSDRRCGTSTTRCGVSTGKLACVRFDGEG